MKFRYSFFLLIFGAASCYSQKEIKNCGSFIIKQSFFDSLSNTFISSESSWPDSKVWFKDSFTVSEINLIQRVVSEDMKTKTVIVPQYYVFVNQKSKSCSVYLNFSDTAKLISKYKRGHEKEDDIITTIGDDYIKLKSVLPPITLTDTIIDDIAYKRSKYIFDKDYRRIGIIYFRCDKMDFLYPFFKSVSQEVGCPIFIYDNIYPTKKTGTRSEISITSAKLTDDELKVFEKWKNNDF